MGEESPSSPLDYTSFADNEHVLGICFSFLGDKDLTNVSRVCKIWSDIAYRDDIWFILAQKRWHLPSSLHKISRSSHTPRQTKTKPRLLSSQQEKRYDDKHHWFHSYKHLVETHKVPGGRFSGNGFSICGISTPLHNTTDTTSSTATSSHGDLSVRPNTIATTLSRLPRLWGWVSLVSTDSCRIPRGKLQLPSLWLPAAMSALLSGSTKKMENSPKPSSAILHHHRHNHHHHSDEDSILCDGCRIAQSIAVQVSNFTQRIIDSDNGNNNRDGNATKERFEPQQEESVANVLASIYSLPYHSPIDEISDDQSSHAFQSFSFVFGGQSLPTITEPKASVLSPSKNNNKDSTCNTAGSHSSTTVPSTTGPTSDPWNKQNDSFHQRFYCKVPVCSPYGDSHLSNPNGRSTQACFPSFGTTSSAILTENIPYLNMKILVQNIGLPTMETVPGHCNSLSSSSSSSFSALSSVLNEVTIGIQGIRLIRRDGRIVYAHLPAPHHTSNDSTTDTASSRRNSQENLNGTNAGNVPSSVGSSLSSLPIIPSANGAIVAVDGNEIYPPVDNVVLPYLSYAVLRVCFPVLPDNTEDTYGDDEGKDMEYLYGAKYPCTNRTVGQSTAETNNDQLRRTMNEEERASVPVFEPEGLESCGIIEIPLWESPSRIYGTRTTVNAEKLSSTSVYSNLPVFIPKVVGVLRIPFLEEGKLWSRYRHVAGGLMIRMDRDDHDL